MTPKSTPIEVDGSVVAHIVDYPTRSDVVWAIYGPQNLVNAKATAEAVLAAIAAKNGEKPAQIAENPGDARPPRVNVAKIIRDSIASGMDDAGIEAVLVSAGAPKDAKYRIKEIRREDRRTEQVL